ncbi:MFS transporter [Rhodotorula toruloides]|uniref:MFS transporter n=1 Tax=Rhodotorula toruloides TaxID=5286 RepID=A0A511K8F5_RHOTO|nr:MFS transporter [Rhodotorula toruloides]
MISRSSSRSSSTATRIEASGSREKENETARGETGDPGPTLEDIEKRGSGAGPGQRDALPSDGKERAGPAKGTAGTPDRDEDGVAVEDGVPIVRLRDPDDPLSPLNFTTARKWLIVSIVTSGAFCITCCSSMIAFTYPGVEREFHVSAEVATLGLSLFVLGMGIFPLLVGPLSEWYGRSPVYFIGFAVYIAFNFGVAFANNIATLLICRFLSGAFASSFLSVAGGTVADLFRPQETGAPMSAYTAGPFLGPVAGPIISGFINQNLDWRWTWYILLIWSAVEFVALLVFVPETYLQAILKKKAQRLRKAGRTDVRAPVEVDERSIATVIMVSCYKPFQILATEPMALALCTWTAILLGILYMWFTAFDIVYGAEGYGFEMQMVGLTYIPIGIGIVTGALCHPIWAGYYRRKAAQLGRRPPPEEHLRKGLWGVCIVPISLFWFAFTTYTSVHWIVSLSPSVWDSSGPSKPSSSARLRPDLVDAFRPVAASAMAANSAMRSSFAAAFPLFTIQMFHRLGTQYALMLTAFLCLAMVPFPFLFFKLGHKYRRGSKFANTED